MNNRKRLFKTKVNFPSSVYRMSTIIKKIKQNRVRDNYAQLEFRIAIFKSKNANRQTRVTLN